MRSKISAVAWVGVFLTSPLLACLWDYDTLNMERARFPGALELITGKFARHSDEYYRWRIEDRTKRLANEPDNLALYDDIAVAHDKLGEHALAIETILKKEAKKPGLYETYANLGTFHIHAGDLEQGLEFIDKAIEINPDAHFGREVYQRLLVQYVLEKRVDGKTLLPLHPEASMYETRGFAEFVLKRQKIADDHEAKKAEIAKATKGVLGMMRFGHYDSPILLEALSDLLVADLANDNKRLAARALLSAAYNTKDQRARLAYLSLAKSQLEMQTRHENTDDVITLNELDNEFSRERGEAENWFIELSKQEKKWIEQGADVDANYKAMYLDEAANAAAVTPDVVPVDIHTQHNRRFTRAVTFGVGLLAATIFGIICFVVLVTFGGVYFWRRRMSAAAK